jgi:hypothetical protein
VVLGPSSLSRGDEGDKALESGSTFGVMAMNACLRLHTAER